MADSETVRWTPSPRTPDTPPGSVLGAISRGLMGRCPVCGRSQIFRGYLRVVDRCAVCGAPLGRARADDAPPYFTIFIVGHIVILGMLALERAAHPALWVHALIWLPLTLLLSLLLLRPIKGATVGATLRFGLMKPADDV